MGKEDNESSPLSMLRRFPGHGPFAYRFPVVKVPGSASPFIIHETPSLLEGTVVAVSHGKGMDKVVCLWTYSDGF